MAWRAQTTRAPDLQNIVYLGRRCVAEVLADLR